jgi:hypothetical protein
MSAHALCYAEFKYRNSLDPRDPDYLPEFEDYEVDEWVESNIEDYATPEILAALGITEEQLIAEPWRLTESEFYEDNRTDFEDDYRRSMPDCFDEPEPRGTWDWSPRGW